ncbi:hypothetical protein J5N97_000669 [Dioscorea zingiberensis]|uniref:ABC transporter domain-containing protein n=1 Tax=Dioscorea zingiberensis TaxID=325984 RepID=A0A9D5BRQ9_9LILI|nr:hypothetical protein J5N97_000669 [Dioscorea zingiberensis]
MERVGIDNPTIEVRFENLKIDAEAYVGNRGLPTFTNFFVNKILALLSSLHIVPSGKRPISILHDISGIIKPCRMTLLLGVGTRFEMLTELSRREKEANIKPDPDIDVYMKAISVEGQETVVTDYILKILGLDICADTMVGDAMIRGISGGQKKRVTTGEMLVGPAKALFMDEISTGLDSSTTYQIVNSLRQSVHILGGTAVIALLQPAPETYDLFDDIILLSGGQVVYQGPRENVLEFLRSMGFKCPRGRALLTSSKSFSVIPCGWKLADELATPFDRSRNHPAALTTSDFGIGKMELLKTNISMEWLLMKRNSFVYIFKIAQLIILGAIAMTVFLRTKMHHDTVEDGVIYLGAMFIGLVTHLFNGFAELAMSVAKLLYSTNRERDLSFYPSWAYGLPTWILKIPISFLECAVWIVLTYYVIGFDPNIERFFRHYLLLVLVSQMASGLFRLLAAVGREMVVADTFGSFAQLVLLVLGGFLISREKIRSWWIWGYWVSPLMYAHNAVAVNEFLGHSWSKVVNATASNDTLGVQILKFKLGYLLTRTALGQGQATVSEEELREKHANRTGESVELLPAGTDSARPMTSSGGGGEIRQAGSGRQRGMVLPFAPLFNHL